MNEQNKTICNKEDQKMKALEIPEDVIDEVVAALARAVDLAAHKAPEMLDGFSQTAVRFDEAIIDALATEP